LCIRSVVPKDEGASSEFDKGKSIGRVSSVTISELAGMSSVDDDTKAC